MTSRHEYIEKLKVKLDEWDADIEELENRTQQTTAELKSEFEDQLISLRLQRDIARLKLAEMMDASEEAWEDLTQGADEAWDNMMDAIEKAWSHFK